VRGCLAFLRSAGGQTLVEYLLGLIFVAGVVSIVVAGVTGALADLHHVIIEYFRTLGRSGL